MTDTFRDLCAELATELEAWEKADDLFSEAGTIRADANYGLAPRARTALAEGDGVGPTDEELIRRVSWMLDGSVYDNDSGDIVREIRGLIADYGTHPRPIPVAERLPTEADCDAEGRCWFSPWHQQGYAPNWRLIEPYLRHFSDAWWLPAHALPTPAQEGADG